MHNLIIKTNPKNLKPSIPETSYGIWSLFFGLLHGPLGVVAFSKYQDRNL